MSPVEVITSVQRRSIQINFLGGGVFSMKGELSPIVKTKMRHF